MNFDDIKPYDDKDYKEVINRLVRIEELMKAVQFYLPDKSIDEIRELLTSFDTIQGFQFDVVCLIVYEIIKATSDGFSYGGCSNLGQDGSQLYITNHRDIVLDSALVNYCLYDTGEDTCEIGIGSNLLSRSWVKDLVKLNKSFIVNRNVPLREFVNTSKHLSDYIHYTLKGKQQSVWLAQREGRAKDGFDKTNPGLLKMLSLSADSDILEHLLSLNIRPVSLSYEYDPCDYLKIPELLAKLEGKEYKKEENEDEENMLQGINGKKGRIHVQFGSSINEKIKSLNGVQNRNELLKGISQIIDGEIYLNYRLWETNYVAYDLLNNVMDYKSKYKEEDRVKFMEYMNDKLKNINKNRKQAEKIFLSMYANPVFNFERQLDYSKN